MTTAPPTKPETDDHEKDAIIHPADGPKMANVGPLAIMVSNETDMKVLCDRLQFQRDRFSRLFMSKLYIHSASSRPFCVVGPVIGAAYAAMVMEKLIMVRQ